MTVTRDFSVLFSTIMICLCEPDNSLHPPKNVKVHWIDAFVLQVDWTMPENLGCQLKYKIQGFKDLRETPELSTREPYLTDMALIDRNISVSTVADNCSGRTESEKVQIPIKTQNHTKLVKDFKCFFESHKMRCVWTPLDPSQHLKVSYRYADKTNISGLERCHPVVIGKQHECYLNANAAERMIWVLVTNGSLANTFVPRLVVPVPNVTIEERADNLTLIWHKPAIGKSSDWNINLNYQECNEVKTITTEKNITIPYKQCCIYKFWYNISTTEYSLNVTSDTSRNITHGQSCFSTSAMVTIVIPAIVFVFVLLSCYCFRRNRAIICPIIPEPSDFFKEMMSGNKDSRMPIVTLYTPPEEPLEPCTLISQSRDLQQIP